MKILKLNPRKSKAQAIIEFAIVLPILLLVIYGLIEAGRLLFIFSFVNNATRQAARYGSTSGVGPNGVPRYQDCAGIRNAAQRSDFLNAIEDDNIDIFIDEGLDNSGNPINQTLYCTGGAVTDTSITPVTGNRITVQIDSPFSPIVPLVPFDPQTIAAESSRTLLLTISIQPPKEDTVTLITADTPDPSEAGQPVTVSVTVTATTTPTGTVNITGADSNCFITLSSGAGSCVVIFSSIGSKTITASYTGDDSHNPSSDTEGHTVIPTSTTTEITADTPDPSLVGAAVTVEVNVTNTFAWGGIPSGTVTITGADGTVPTCTITLSGGTGDCNVNFSSVGDKTLTATYNPASAHATSSDTEDHTVISPAQTVTTITTDSPDPSGIGQSVTVTVAVTGSTTPTGTVAITGADTNCTITLSGGTGSCNVVFNSVGNKTISAAYTPDSPAHNGSSDTESHSVQLAPTTTTITADAPEPSDIGQAVSVTVTVTGGTTTPTGTVTITGADTNCTITLSGGTGSCNVNFSTPGSKTLTATYNGDGTHAGSNDLETHMVVQPPVIGCNTTNITVGLLQQTGGNMTMTINNTLPAFLQIANVSVTWNHDKGHQTGDDKTLILQSARLNPGSTFWTGNETDALYTITPASPTFIQPGVSTIIFSFHQTFDRWDDTESITINFSSPGCGGVILFQNQH